MDWKDVISLETGDYTVQLKLENVYLLKKTKAIRNLLDAAPIP